MDTLNKWRRFLSLTTKERNIFLEALFISAYVRFSLSFLPFKRVLGWLGTANLKQLSALPDAHLLHIVKLSIQRVNANAPWKTECYTQALTGKILLNKRKLKPTLYIGFKKDLSGKYKGHAWLKYQDYFVTGEQPGLSEFQVHAHFT